MSKILYLDEARQHTLSAGPNHLLRLLPGRNVVDDDLFDAVLNTVGKKEKGPTQLQQMIDKGTVKVTGETVDITKMNANKALEIIELETEVEGLEDLLTQESGKKKPRKTIVEAIEGKIELIESPENPDEENE